MGQIAVRKVDEKVFKAFKAKAVVEGLNVGEALTLAMKEWIDERGERESFLTLKPVDWGKGTEKTSKDIDKLLYGTH